jgi:hypothetical protein|nr:MAG TPA: hypothetical protein [Caudoviricetes sp.]
MTVEIIAMSLLVLIMANNTTRKRETIMEKIYGTRSYWKAVFKQERKQKIKKALTYICAFFLFTMPVWMFLDYIAKGY